MQAIELGHKTLSDVNPRNYYGTQFGNWVVCNAERPTLESLLEVSNWQCVKTALKNCPDGTWDIFGSRVIAAKPDSVAHRVIAEINCALSDYPVLDEEDYSQRRYDRDIGEIERHAEDSTDVAAIFQVLFDNELLEDIDLKKVRAAELILSVQGKRAVQGN